MNTALQPMSEPMYEWKELPWSKIERQVFKLQKRIYQASRRGDVKTVRKLQKLLMKSWAAKCLAVRKVTQDNRGKKTAGVDGVKSLTPPQRLKLTRTLQLSSKAQPARRVWIPKPGKAEMRPLGIPTLRDRAAQALAKLALEPAWEAKFEPNSYGFRPGRSCHDAMVAIRLSIQYKPKYVLDADIAQCFDRIDHQALLNKLNTFPTLRRAIRSWLRAGVMDGGSLFPTSEGTPQGGVISPLLANIALHGLETIVRQAFVEEHQGESWKPNVIRYADDFVILHPNLAAIERAQQVAQDWLADMGLELKPSKTTITHTLHEHNSLVGFDFLGFHVRQHRVGKTHCGKSGGKGRASVSLGYVTRITPSKTAVKRHLAGLAEIIRTHHTAPQAALISRLNPVTRGWTNYYSAQHSAVTFNKVAHLTFRKLGRWAIRRHRRKPWKWIARKYWQGTPGARWDFVAPGGIKLYRHDATRVRMHIKVQGARSPFDGNWLYWAGRMGKHPEVPGKIAWLLKKQHGKCAWCGLHFREGGDLIEADHFIPQSQNGTHGYLNWQLLHGHCHDRKTARDNALVRGAYDKRQTVEEPDEGKLSRPVL